MFEDFWDWNNFKQKFHMPWLYPKEEDRASMGLAVQTTGEAIPGAETFKRKITPLVPVKAPEDDWETVFPKPACLSLQQRFEWFKRWRILVQAVQARKYLLDGLQAGL